ncbi:MAG: helix-turn-helix domain-containing protein [Bacteroidota bacterium]
MNYYTIQPPLALQPYVRCFWVLEHELGADEDSYVYRSVADGCVEMVFHYQSAFDELVTDGVAHNWLSGMHFQSSKFRRFETRQSFGIFGAYIYPFAVPVLFNIPSAETSNEMLGLDVFLGREGSELEEKMMLADCNYKRAEILSEWLQKRLLNIKNKDVAIATAVKHVIHSAKISTVEQLASRFNLSERQFNRKFKEYAGFSPKMYMRLTRLNKAIKQQVTDKPLGQVAYECGYYDQSHFIHELKEFTGYHPSFYFSGKAEGTEWLYI